MTFNLKKLIIQDDAAALLDSTPGPWPLDLSLMGVNKTGDRYQTALRSGEVNEGWLMRGRVERICFAGVIK